MNMHDTASCATSVLEHVRDDPAQDDHDHECSIIFSQDSSSSSSSYMEQQRCVPAVDYKTLVSSSEELVRRTFAASGLGAIIVTDIPGYCVHRNALLPLAHQVLSGCHVTSAVHFHPVTHSIRRPSLYGSVQHLYPSYKTPFFPSSPFYVVAQTACSGEAVSRGLRELLAAGLAPLLCVQSNSWRPKHGGEFASQNTRLACDNLIK